MVGNATTGICLSLQAAGLTDKQVAIPNNVCINVPMAVKYSGNHPVYLDCSRDTMGLSTQALINSGKKFDAVIAVHAYGAVCDIEGISEYCKKQGIFLIEDFAPAQGASIRGRMTGSFGDVSIGSFGAGKIIDIGHGGAVFTNDESLMKEIMACGERLQQFTPEKEAIVERLSRHHTALYNEFYGNDLSSHCDIFNGLIDETRDSILYRFDKNYVEPIANSLRSLEDNIRKRAEKAQRLISLFSERKHDSIELFIPPEGSVYWRFNVFLKEKRDIILKTLLRKRFKISSWFPSVDMFFYDRALSDPSTPVSDWIGDHILNIWVNDEVDAHYLDAVTQQLFDSLDNKTIHEQQ